MLPTWDTSAAVFDMLTIAWVIVLCCPVGGRRARRRPPRAAGGARVAGGLVLIAPLWIAPSIAPNEPWWKEPSAQGGADPRFPNPASEPVLATQRHLLDDALADLDDERPDVTDLYFVGFAGDAREDVFRKDVLAAQKVMDERWGTEGRSIALINNPRTLLEAPVASVTNLRETLNEIGAAIDTEQDVVMVYLASHGGPGPRARRLAAAARTRAAHGAARCGACSTRRASSGGSSSCRPAIPAASSTRCRTTTR